MGDETVVRLERVGLVLSLVLLAAGLAELTEAIDLLPMAVYLALLWAIALSLWLVRRRRSGTRGA